MSYAVRFVRRWRVLSDLNFLLMTIKASLIGILVNRLTTLWEFGTNGQCCQQELHDRLGRCETPSKGTILEEERGERNHLHHEGMDGHNQSGWGAQPSSRSLLEAVVLRDLVSRCIHSADEGSSQSRNI